MGAYAVPLQIAGTVISAFGAIQKGNREAEGFNANAQASEYNAAMSEQQAGIARQQAAAQAVSQQAAGLKFLGKMRAGYGASGLTMEGSATDVLAESAANVELDRLNIMYGGEMQAYGHERTAALDRSQASYYRSEASRAKSAGYGNAVAALFQGGMQAYGMTSGMAGGGGGGMFAGISPSASSGGLFAPGPSYGFSPGMDTAGQGIRGYVRW